MRLAAPILSCALALWGSSALAQSEEAKAQAQRRYEEGLALHNRDQEEEAYTRFAQAFAVLQSPPILFNLARTEQLTGRLVEAARHFKEYLEHPDHPRITPGLREKARGFLAEIEAMLGHITVEAPTGTTITLDGVAAATGTLDVQPGTHAIVGQLGPVSRTLTVSCTSGQTVKAQLVFETPRPSSPALPNPSDSIAPNPLTSSVPAETAAPPASSAGVSAAGTGVRWGLTGAAAVTLGLGIGFDVASHSEKSDALSYAASHPGACTNMTSPSCAAFGQMLGNGSTTLSYVFFSVGIASALGAAIAWVWWPKEKHGETGWVLPAIGPDGGGLYAGGSF
jgi:hypothetical protein